MRRTVFDTSTLVSAALMRDSVPYQALLKALASGVLCASAETLEELDIVLEREKFERYLGLAARQEFAAWIRRNTLIFAVEMYEEIAGEPLCRDAKDRKFLALASAATADAIVSSDIHLLELNPWREIPILKPAAFLDCPVERQSDDNSVSTPRSCILLARDLSVGHSGPSRLD